MRKHTDKPTPAGMTPSEMAMVGRFVSSLGGESRPRPDPVAQQAAADKKKLILAFAELDDVAGDGHEFDEPD